MTPDKIVASARSLIGTPFDHQGRLPGVALDCAGVVCAVAIDLGLEHVDVEGYGRQPHANLLKITLDDQPAMIEVDKKTMRDGDVLLMRFGREPQHLAICAGENVIHSYEAVGMVCEHRLDATWLSRIVAVYRFSVVA